MWGPSGASGTSHTGGRREWGAQADPPGGALILPPPIPPYFNPMSSP